MGMNSKDWIIVAVVVLLVCSYQLGKYRKKLELDPIISQLVAELEACSQERTKAMLEAATVECYYKYVEVEGGFVAIRPTYCTKPKEEGM